MSTSPTITGPHGEHEYPEFVPKIIGIYGLPGSGKSTLLKQLQDELRSIKDGSDNLKFHFFDGSEAIREVMPLTKEGDDVMRAFREMNQQDQTAKREEAISAIHQACKHQHHHAIVAAHYLFCHGDKGREQVVWMEKDREIYTHMPYLELEPAKIQAQRASDQ